MKTSIPLSVTASVEAAQEIFSWRNREERNAARARQRKFKNHPLYQDFLLLLEQFAKEGKNELYADIHAIKKANLRQLTAQTN